MSEEETKFGMAIDSGAAAGPALAAAPWRDSTRPHR